MLEMSVETHIEKRFISADAPSHCFQKNMPKR